MTVIGPISISRKIWSEANRMGAGYTLIGDKTVLRVIPQPTADSIGASYEVIPGGSNEPSERWFQEAGKAWDDHPDEAVLWLANKVTQDAKRWWKDEVTQDDLDALKGEERLQHSWLEMLGEGDKE